MLETLIALGRVNKRGNKMEVQVAGNSETLRACKLCKNSDVIVGSNFDGELERLLNSQSLCWISSPWAIPFVEQAL